MSVRRAVLAVGALWVCSAWAGSPVEAGKVYSGDDGIEISIVPLAPRSKNQAIVLFKGTDSEVDGRALLHDVDGSGDRVDYRTTLHGRGYVTLFLRSSWGSRGLRLIVPGGWREVGLVYSEKKTQDLKGDAVYALYEKQNKDGSTAALQAFDRKGEEAQHDKKFAASLDSMNKACGTKVAATIDWKSVSDDLLKTHSISSFCAHPLSALERLCSSTEAKKVIQDKVKRLSCQFGKEMKLEVTGSAVAWTTEKDAANQEEFATKYFEKNL
jgi:hypothetical protein